jgi:DNA-binding beta-propeller fold protein YncE
MGTGRVVAALVTGVVVAAGVPSGAAAGAVASVPTVNVLAGVAGAPGFCGDGGPARAACLNRPNGVAVDRETGDLYIADTDNNRIRKISPSGQISTAAGSTLGGICGDGGPAVEACLSRPSAVTVDPATGDLYVAAEDPGTNYTRIRRVGRGTGRITTVAGGGSCKHAGGQGGPDLSACLDYVQALAADGHGGVYLGQPNEVDHLGADGVLRRVAGGRSCVVGFNKQFVYGSVLGALLVGDGGPATAACLDGVSGLAQDRDGSLLIADTGNNRLRKVDPSGVIGTVAGNGLAGRGIGPPDGCPPTLFTCPQQPPCPADGPARAVCLTSPTGVAVGPDDSVFITGITGFDLRLAEAMPDHDTARQAPAYQGPTYGTVWRLDAQGLLSVVAGNPYVRCTETNHAHHADGVPGRAACLAGISGVAVRESGPVIVTPETNQALTIGSGN